MGTVKAGKAVVGEMLMLRCWGEFVPLAKTNEVPILPVLAAALGLFRI
jgi:hypothetical protein